MITVIDYQMGNLRSVQKGFERVGHAAQITSDPDRVRRAERLVLPGVGAFGQAMDELHRRELPEAIWEAVERGVPMLGICLGLQLLFDSSEESPGVAGLGIVPGRVVRFDLPAPWKVPHMGWNQARIARPSPVLAGIEPQTSFYFVHSYYVVPDDPNCVTLECDYGQPFCAMIARQSLVATQFHPEKSQAAGLRLLANFAQWRP